MVAETKLSIESESLFLCGQSSQVWDEQLCFPLMFYERSGRIVLLNSIPEVL